ncbi:MAG: spore coat protein [Bacillaceae bacterium]|nr:spore coat protein [Bacillaceae bacterium]
MEQSPKHLAWHETLEIHELVAFQSIGLIKLKSSYRKIDCATLKGIYKDAIDGISANIRELLEFYGMAPTAMREDRNEDSTFYAGDLLALAKSSVRNYAIALTETATPELRKVLTKQLTKSIDLHANVFNYMQQRNDYPAYSLRKLLENDVNLANKALSKPM